MTWDLYFHDAKEDMYADDCKSVGHFSITNRGALPLRNMLAALCVRSLDAQEREEDSYAFDCASLAITEDHDDRRSDWEVWIRYRKEVEANGDDVLRGMVALVEMLGCEGEMKSDEIKRVAKAFALVAVEAKELKDKQWTKKSVLELAELFARVTALPHDTMCKHRLLKYTLYLRFLTRNGTCAYRFSSKE